jgi:uncharacterized protein YgfB (UPF0149 family)
MSQSQSLPSFDIFCDALLSLGAINSPSELQGMACGKLAGGADMPLEQWQEEAAEFLDLTSTPDGRTHEMLMAVLQVSKQQLFDAEFGLQILLPDDDSELAIRAEALGQWCHGFLSGFGSAGIGGDRQLTGDVSDAIRDLAAIVEIGVEDDVEGSETDFMEIVEYVRVAVMTVHADYAQPATKATDKPDKPDTDVETTLH